MHEREIGRWRKEIDEINRDLLKLLSRRARCAGKIGEIKKKYGLPVLNRSREAAILETLAEKNRGPFPDDAIKNIFRAIMKETRKLEHTV